MSANYIQAYGEGLIFGTAGIPCKFTVNPNGQDLQGITFAVEGPSRPTFTFAHIPGGIVEVMYTPTFPGPYRIYIKFYGRDVPGSPFQVNVAGDVTGMFSAVNNVKVSGPAVTQGRSLVTNQFLLDARNSGVAGGLNAFMEGPGRAEVGFKENLDGTLHIQYKPSNSGIYKLHLKFGEAHVPGSPFTINVN